MNQAQSGRRGHSTAAVFLLSDCPGQIGRVVEQHPGICIDVVEQRAESIVVAAFAGDIADQNAFDLPGVAAQETRIYLRVLFAAVTDEHEFAARVTIQNTLDDRRLGVRACR